MTALQALRSATVDTATLLGTPADTGSIEAGKLADIVGLGADPLADIRALRTIAFVMKDGEVVRDEWKNRRPGTTSAARQ